MAIDSDWCVGAWEGHPSFTFTVGGNSKTIPAGSAYLYDADSNVSLVHIVEAKIQEEVPSAAVAIQRSGKITIDAGATITLAWGSDTTLRDALGFTADLSSSSTTGANHTKYLWRPGTTASPRGGSLDTAGSLVTDRQYHESVSKVSSTGNNSWYEQTIEWVFVLNAAYQTSSRDPGEFAQFYEDVIEKAHQFKVYRKVQEDSTDTDATLTGLTVLPTSDASSTAYVMKPPRGGSRFKFNRYPGLETVDKGHTVSIDVRTVAALT